MPNARRCCVRYVAAFLASSAESSASISAFRSANVLVCVRIVSIVATETSTSVPSRSIVPMLPLTFLSVFFFITVPFVVSTLVKLNLSRPKRFESSLDSQASEDEVLDYAGNGTLPRYNQLAYEKDSPHPS